ncbi:MAG TPA: hypothetical protein VJ463_07140 [Geothrix sp.]|nr:hypothetical protein [Geothrix sp.]
MNRTVKTAGLVAAGLLGGTLFAEDFKSLMDTARTTWPEKTHIGVICDYQKHQDTVWALARAAGVDCTITVVDARSDLNPVGVAAALGRQKVDYFVMMPQELRYHDGIYTSTVVIGRLASEGIPTVATTSIALKQGAVFSVGDATGGQILVNDRLIGTIDVQLPERSLVTEKSSLVLQREGMATLLVRTLK